MSTAQTWQTDSTSLEDTLALAETIGRKLRGSEIIELISDLGGGKTAFVRGLAKGMGSNDAVRSPSFTLSNQYQADGLTLYHFDLYRLSEPGIIKDEIAELISDPQAVLAVEWAGIVEDVLPVERLQIKIRATGEATRQITLTCPEKFQYLKPFNT